MALVSGGRSSLNPNAPLFVPAAVRQVEDFSPEWWNLVTTATWFRDYWLNEQHGEDVFGEWNDDENDVIGLLPDSIDLGVDEDILNMEEQFEEFLQSSEAHDYFGSKATRGITENGVGKNAGALVKTLSMPKERGAMREGVKNWEKPAKIMSPRCSPRSIQQPR
ncbi:hypothetical protein ACS0TY_031764 [Phlomoides rotata]